MNGDQLENADPISINVRIGIETRIARIENEVQHKASKEDLANLKVWTLATMLGAAISLIVAVGTIAARFWPS